jgi:hypothetical protein
MVDFQTKKPFLGNNLGAIIGICLFNGHLVYFTYIWYNLWLFGILAGYLVYSPPPLVSIAGKNLATLIVARIPTAYL